MQMLIGPLFAGIPGPVLDTLMRTSTVRSFAPGQALFHEEDSAELLVLVVEGAVRVWRTSSKGGALTVHLMGPGGLPGCATVFGQQRYPASATAVTGAKIATWPAERISELMADCPTLATNALGVVATHTQEMLQRLHEVSTQPVEQRLAGTILRLIDSAPEGDDAIPEIQLSRQALAELTATTLHTVSRFISRWERRGIVRAARKRIGILQPDTLLAIHTRA